MGAGAGSDLGGPQGPMRPNLSHILDFGKSVNESNRPLNSDSQIEPKNPKGRFQNFFNLFPQVSI